MKLRIAIASLCAFALAAMPVRAQHGGGHAGGGSHGGGGWHAGSAASGGGHASSGAGASHGYASGSYGAAEYRPAAGSHPSAVSGETARPASSYYTSHDPAGQSGWQTLYSSGSSIRFTASMLPPNARGYSAAPRHVAAAVVRTPAETAAHRLQLALLEHSDFDGRFRLRRRFRGGFFETWCGPFVGFGFCGGPFFYGAALNCLAGNYWDASGLTAEPAWSPCFAPAYTLDDEQVSPDAWDGPDVAPADQDSTDDANAAPDADSTEQPEAAPVSASQRPETLLQLKDGSMYGLVQYWVAGGLLNYITDYGARNAVPLDCIDLAKTVQLNSQRGVPFVLESNPPSN